MSKIALTGNASGSGTFTLAAPNSDTDRVLTLPDGAGTIATTNGITSANKFYLSANVSADASPITGWEKDTPSIGDDVTVSGGVFTFPSTGIWFYTFTGIVQGTDNFYQFNFDINGTRFEILYSECSESDAVSKSGIIDITNTATQTFNIDFVNVNSLSLKGGTSSFPTTLNFIRLGDT